MKKKIPIIRMYKKKKGRNKKKWGKKNKQRKKKKRKKRKKNKGKKKMKKKTKSPPSKTDIPFLSRSVSTILRKPIKQ